MKHIVTDSASNVKKAFLTLPGFEDDVEQRSDSEDQIDDVNDDDDDNEEILEAQSISSEDMPLEYYLCFAHTFQLVVKDGLKKAGQINTVIKRCSNLVSFTQKSTVATDTLNGEKSPQNDNVTRWNSKLKMMRSVLSIPESKLSEIDGAPKLLAYDRNVLPDIVEILTPLVKATDSVQVDCVPLAGYVLPCIKGLSHYLKGMVSKYHSAFVSGLKSSMERCMPYYEGNETYILAAILDPRFKLRWCSNNSERKKSTEILKEAA